MTTEAKQVIVDEIYNSGALDVSLHPLVILNISDHFTRSKVRTNEERVFGALMGQLSGRKVEIYDSFELVCKDNVFDLEFLQLKSQACMFLLMHFSPLYSVTYVI